MGKNTKGGKKHKKQKNKGFKGGSEKNSSNIIRPSGDDQCIGRIVSSLGSKRFMVKIKGKEYNCRLRGSRQLKGSSAYATDNSYCLCSHRGYENVYDILNVYHLWEKVELEREQLIVSEKEVNNDNIIFDSKLMEEEKEEDMKDFVKDI
jgi:hypothetical protein